MCIETIDFSTFIYTIMTRLNSNKIHLNNKGYDFSTFIYTIMIIVYDPIKLEQNPFEQ